MAGLESYEKYLLQQFLQYSVLDQYNFKEIFKKILQKFHIDYDTADNDSIKGCMVSSLRNINNSIKKFSMEIKNGTCELSGTTFYCLVRQYDLNNIGKLAALYTPSELKVFKIILNTIVVSEEGIVDKSSILTNLFDDPEGLKISSKEIRVIFDKFIKDHWIIETSDKLVLHSRTIMELSQYMLEMYGAESVVNCHLCKEIAVIGITCENCHLKMHKHCAKRVFKNTNDCLSCKNPFPKEVIVKTCERTHAQQTQQQLSATQPASRSRPSLPITDSSLTQLNGSTLNKRRK